MAGLLEILQGLGGGQQQPNATMPAAQPQPQVGGWGDKLRELGPIIAMMDPMGRNNTMAAAMMQMQQGKKKDARDTANQNQTVQWLKTQGMGEQEASYLASDKDALRSWYGEWKTGDKPDWKLQEIFDDKGRKIKVMMDMRDGRYNQIGGAEDKSKTEGAEFGLTPVYGKNKDNKIVLGQLSKSGQFQETALPEGFDLTPGVDKVDLGTAWGITNRAGDVVSTIPKQLQEAEEQKAVGKAVGESRGEAQVNLGSTLQKADQSIGLIDQMLEHPGLDTAVGLSGTLDPRNYMAGTDATDFNVRRKQLEGRAFLEAFESLKGAGQITEVEGVKATEAIARLSTAQSEKAYREALTELKGILEQGKTRAQSKAGSAPPSNGGVDYKSKYGLD